MKRVATGTVGASSAASSPAAQAWFGFGRFVSTHMVIVAPLCVALGAAFPQLFSWMAPAVEVLFAFMTFQSSMGTTARGLLDVVRHPAHLIGCLLVLLVGMPLVGFAAGNIFLHGQHDIILGVVLEYCVPMGVTGLMWTEIYNGNKALSIAVCVISTVLAPITLPAMMQLLMGATIHIDVWGMMADLAFMVAIPALAGVLCNDLSHGKANAQVAPWLSPLGRIFLIAVLLANSTHIAGPIRQINPTLVGTMALMLVLGMTGYFGGYVVARLMHADVSDSFSMGICTGCRNISSGAVLAAAYFPDITMFPVLMGTLFQHMIAGLYGWFIRRMEARNTPALVTVDETAKGNLARAEGASTTADKTAGEDDIAQEDNAAVGVGTCPENASSGAGVVSEYAGAGAGGGREMAASTSTNVSDDEDEPLGK